MPFVVRKLPGEPIIITTIALPLHRYTQNLRSLNAQIAGIAARESGQLYRIMDGRNVELSFSDILLYLDENRSGPGTLADPRLHSIFVSPHPMGEVLVRKLAREMDLVIPHFRRLDEALHYARAQIRASQPPCRCDAHE